MLITRIPPTVPELVARAIASTPFVTESASDDPHDMRICAELCAELAAEHWETEHRVLIGETLPGDLIAGVAQGLIAHVQALREAALYAGLAKVEKAITTLATLKAGIAGQLPIPKAETQMDHAEADLGRLGVALRRAADELECAIDAHEWAKSATLRGAA